MCTVSHKCLDYVKSAAKKTLPTEDTYFTGIEDTSLSLEDTVLEQMEKEHLANICRSLKPPYDEIAVQYFCEELSVSEISVHTGKKHKTIQTQIYRAKQLLKKHLAKGDMIHGK